MLPPRKCTIHVRHLALGGAAPIAVQSMAATRTQDVGATLRQVKLLERLLPGELELGREP
jgi:4-hydroxy-3-methylbut-2-en-1-yl diphosphate synthase IspG/GcpE